MELKHIKTQTDYNLALKRLEEIFDAKLEPLRVMNLRYLD